MDILSIAVDEVNYSSNTDVAQTSPNYNLMQQWLDENIGDAPWTCMTYQVREEKAGEEAGPRKARL